MAMSSSEQIRLLVADDHPMFRDGIRVVIAADPEFTLVGEAADGVEAVALAAELQPDVVIMDLNLPGVHGIDATRQVVTTSPHIGVLVLTMFDDDDSVFAAMRAGARGYLLKGAGQAELLRAVRTVAAGGVILGPRVARRMQRFFDTPASIAPFPTLTAREHEVLDLLAAGRSNPEIASTLNLSGKTVRNHVSNVFTKLQVADRAQAIVRAREAGLGQTSPAERR
jgi:DNA-binding NarL/FixJ family response regulator